MSGHVKKDLKISLVVSKEIMQVTHSIASGVVTVSNGTANDLSKLTQIPREDFKVIYNPVINDIAPSKSITYIQSFRKEFWKHRFDHYLISIGSFKKQKNQALLIKAFSNLLPKLNVGLTILGDGPLRPELENLIEEAGLKQKVFLPGFQADISPWLLASDLFVLSSDFEGFANVIVEALACGTPIVSTNCPYGPSEILKNGQYGTLVPTGDVDALAMGIREALQQKCEPRSLQDRALDFSIAKQSLEYQNFFKSI